MLRKTKTTITLITQHPNETYVTNSKEKQPFLRISHDSPQLIQSSDGKVEIQRKKWKIQRTQYLPPSEKNIFVNLLLKIVFCMTKIKDLNASG